MNAPSLPPAIGEETVPPGEPAQIAELIAILRTIQEEKDRRRQPVPRTVHPKQHGCVRAELTVETGLGAAVRHGIFREARPYAALVRFSNAKQRNDQLPDGHGMAIKLVGVEGGKLLESDREATTQDFVLIDHPVFFAKNVADMIPLLRDFRVLMMGGWLQKSRTGLKAALSRDYRYRLLRTMGKRPDSPLSIQYWSTTPFKLGASAMKFSLRPELEAAPAAAENSADQLRLAMTAHLAQLEARFELLVQLQADPAATPIEDPTILWDDTAAPYQKVATLRIPPQRFDAPAQMSLGENLSFTPWHCLPEHRPLGGINRARRAIYEAMAARRIELNGALKREPTLDDLNVAWSSSGAR